MVYKNLQKEALQVRAALQHRPVSHLPYFRGVGPHMPTLNDETEEIHRKSVKLAFLCLDISVFEETLEHQADMLDVPLQVLGEDEDVIQVDKHEPTQHVVEDVVDQILEHHRRIGETERHNQVFKMA